jgi:plastocyanin
MGEFRKRILEPLTLPLAGAIVVAILVFSVSRILLAVEEAASTIIALVVAAEVLGIAAVLAATGRMKAAQRGLLILVGLSLIAGGGASAKIGIRKIEPVNVQVIVVAKGIQYTTPVVQYPPDTPFTLKFSNDDAGVPHDVNVTSDPGGTQTLFKTAIFAGVSSQGVKTPALKAATYFFHCDVHPSMKGQLVPQGAPVPSASPSPPAASATPSSAPPSGGAGKGPTQAQISASGVQFNTDRLALAANAADTLEFDNKDAGVPHNVDITKDEAGTDSIFKQDPIQGPKTVTWSLTGPAPGTYYFHCDVHPNMKGTIVFS